MCQSSLPGIRGGVLHYDSKVGVGNRWSRRRLPRLMRSFAVVECGSTSYIGEYEMEKEKLPAWLVGKMRRAATLSRSILFLGNGSLGIGLKA